MNANNDKSYDDENIFAKILRNEIPCHKIYEDDLCLVFLDIFPINPGHFLVVPKARAVTLPELDEEMACHLFRVGHRLSKALRASGLRCEGVNFWVSDGAAAGQEVPHVHLHVIPRWAGDGFGWKVGPGNRQSLPKEELARLAELLRNK